MSHFARVGREALYAAQIPLQSDGNTNLLPETMAHLKISPMDQPTWQQEDKFSASKNKPKNREWQRFDFDADTAADDTRGGVIVPIVPIDSTTGLAPSSLPPPAPSTPTPSATTSPHVGEQSQQHQGPHLQPRGNQQSNIMTRIPTDIERLNLAPHRRKALRDNARASANAKTPALEEEKTQGPQSADTQPVKAGPAQSGRNGASGLAICPKAPLSPPSTPAETYENQASAQWGELQVQPIKPQEAELNAIWAYEEPKPEPRIMPRLRNRNFASPPRNKARHVWPKNRDMRPQSHDESDGGVECKSDSNGDPDYDVRKLIDWNGDWLPPPESWSARHTFTNRHFGASLEKWMNGHDASCTVNLTDLLEEVEYKGVEVPGRTVFIDGKPVADLTINSEIAPRSWVPSNIEGSAPNSFWEDFLERAPSALSDIDIREYRPFWEEYKDSNGCFLNLPQQPTKSVLDPNDEENRKPAARKTATEALRNIDEKRRARDKRHQAKRNKPCQALPAPVVRPGYRPTSNVYFRPVVAADARGIRELYNYYVEKTIHAPEFSARAMKDIVERIRTITDEGLPYIVAVAKGLHVRGPQDYVSERIVGFASIDDYCDKGSIFRFTFELECFVHPDFLRQNIAKCLLDRLLEMVNTSYPAKGGYVWVNHGEYLKHGSRRVVKVVNVSVHHEQDENIDWVTEFLRKFKFRKAGHLFKVGYKLGKTIDLTTYQHETTELIDAAVPPLQPL